MCLTHTTTFMGWDSGGSAGISRHQPEAKCVTRGTGVAIWLAQEAHQRTDVNNVPGYNT